MAFLSAAEIEASLYAALAEVPDPTQPKRDWGQCIADARRMAEVDIRQALRRRGYTTAQIDGWDECDAYHRPISLYWVGILGKHHFTESQCVNLDRLNRIEDLLDVDITNGGEVIDPGDEETAGAVASGAMVSATDIFRPNTSQPIYRTNVW